MYFVEIENLTKKCTYTLSRNVRFNQAEHWRWTSGPYKKQWFLHDITHADPIDELKLLRIFDENNNDLLKDKL